MTTIKEIKSKASEKFNEFYAESIRKIDEGENSSFSLKEEIFVNVEGLSIRTICYYRGRNSNAIVEIPDMFEEREGGYEFTNEQSEIEAKYRQYVSSVRLVEKATVKTLEKTIGVESSKKFLGFTCYENTKEISEKSNSICNEMQYYIEEKEDCVLIHNGKKTLKIIRISDCLASDYERYACIMFEVK